MQILHALWQWCPKCFGELPNRQSKPLQWTTSKKYASNLIQSVQGAGCLQMMAGHIVTLDMAV